MIVQKQIWETLPEQTDTAMQCLNFMERLDTLFGFALGEVLDSTVFENHLSQGSKQSGVDNTSLC